MMDILRTEYSFLTKDTLINEFKIKEQLGELIKDIYKEKYALKKNPIIRIYGKKIFAKI